MQHRISSSQGKKGILNALDRGKIRGLVLLDLSAGFDTIDHNILLNRLHTGFGIKDVALKWFNDYQTDSTQWVIIGNQDMYGEYSDTINLQYGVPQRGIQDPILSHYTLFHHVTSVRKTTSNTIYMLMTPNYTLPFKPSTSTVNEYNIYNLHACIAEIHKWMCINMLKLNENKTEFIS